MKKGLKLLKILFLISTLANDGAERAMSNITTHLPEGVEADILVNSVSSQDYPTRANIINLGMKPDAVKGLGYQLIATCKRIKMLRQLKKTKHYDACISFMDSANICNILSGNKYCKTILSVRVSISADKSFAYRYIVSPLVRLFYNKADCVTACSEEIHKELVEKYRIKSDKVVTITNGYDIETIHRMMEEESELTNRLNIKNHFVYVTAGRFSEQKSQWHLIRAFSKVARQCDDTLLLIMGKGKEEAYLKEIIRENNLEEKVLLIPYQKNPFSILRDCDVFVMPSLFEGYCNALCEALICKLPCIATDFPSSAREILAPDTDYTCHMERGVDYALYGILTPVCSGTHYKGMEPLEKQEEELAEAMQALYENASLLEHYKKQALKRGRELDINMKVKEWLVLVEH